MSEQKLQLTVSDELAGERLDKCLAELVTDYSRSWLQKQIKLGKVFCNGDVCKTPRYPVEAGMSIEILMQEPEEPKLIGENIDLPVLYEDDHILVINKPPNMVVHPGAGNWTGTVVNALLGRDSEFGADMECDENRPGIVHRLDKDTSGCLIIAKNHQAMANLMNSFAHRKTKKTYAALLCGIPQYVEGQIVNQIGRHPVNRKKMAVVDRNGKVAVTKYELMEYGKVDGYPISLMRVNILTGRTHQIRVHMSSIKLPVLGDTLYGGDKKLQVSRQMLHAWKIVIPHPTTGEEMTFKAPWPDDFQDIVDQIEPYEDQ